MGDCSRQVTGRIDGAIVAATGRSDRGGDDCRDDRRDSRLVYTLRVIVGDDRSDSRGDDRPCIRPITIVCWLKGVTNFVIYKFGHLVANEWQTMYDLAKMFLHCLNHWKLDTPTARKQQQQGQSDDLALYRVNYTR